MPITHLLLHFFRLKFIHKWNYFDFSVECTQKCDPKFVTRMFEYVQQMVNGNITFFEKCGFRQFLFATKVKQQRNRQKVFEKKLSEPWSFRIKKFKTMKCKGIPSTLYLSVQRFLFISRIDIINSRNSIKNLMKLSEQNTENKKKKLIWSFYSGSNVEQCLQLEADSTEPLFSFDVSM